MNLKNELRKFTGTTAYHRLSLFPILVTDGVRFLAQEAKCYWLIDEIGANTQNLDKVEERFAVVKLKLNADKDQGVLRITNGNSGKEEVEYLNQLISYTDFPIDEIELYLQKGEQSWVLMLTSEY